MGNTIRGKKSVKVMKITGETMKLRTPIKANEVVKDHAGHVLLDSEAVKHFGIRAKPLEPQQELSPKRLYFLVELPKSENDKVPRRARSGINVSAKERLESLMLARRSTSDLSILKPSNSTTSSSSNIDGSVGGDSTSVRVKMRVSKAEMERLVDESRDDSEIAAKIADLCMKNAKINNVLDVDHGVQDYREQNGQVRGHVIKPRDKKRVSFMPINEAEMQIAAVPVASC